MGCVILSPEFPKFFRILFIKCEKICGIGKVHFFCAEQQGVAILNFLYNNNYTTINNMKHDIEHGIIITVPPLLYTQISKDVIKLGSSPCLSEVKEGLIMYKWHKLSVTL